MTAVAPLRAPTDWPGAGQHVVCSHQLDGPGDEFGRILYLLELGALEEVGVEQRSQHRPYIAVAFLEGCHQRVYRFGIVGRLYVPGGNLWLIRYEEVVEVAGQESVRRLLLDNDVHDVLAVEVARLSEECLLAVVVVFGNVLEA